MKTISIDRKDLHTLGKEELPRPTRVAAIIEAMTVTGPAKNLLDFAVSARVPGRGPTAHVDLLSFVRCPSPSAIPDNVFLAAARQRNLPATVIWERGRFDTGVLGRLSKELTRIQPDIVQTHGVKSHFLVALLKLRGSFPWRWLAFHHGYTSEDLKTLLYNKLNIWSVPRADHVVTVCTPFAKMLAKSGVRGDKIDVLPNAIDVHEKPSTERIAALRQKLGIEDSERVILAVGRFSSEKGHEDLLRALQQVVLRQPGMRIRLVLVGDGLLRRKLEGLVSALQMSSVVIFAGQQRDVFPYYALADLFVLPSHSEGSPNVLLEAMSASLPIVSTSVGGVPDTVTHDESALLVPARQPAALADAMERLLCDGEVASRLRHNGASRVARDFQVDNYRRRLLDIHWRVLHGR